MSSSSSCQSGLRVALNEEAKGGGEFVECRVCTRASLLSLLPQGVIRKSASPLLSQFIRITGRHLLRERGGEPHRLFTYTMKQCPINTSNKRDLKLLFLEESWNTVQRKCLCKKHKHHSVTQTVSSKCLLSQITCNILYVLCKFLHL